MSNATPIGSASRTEQRGSAISGVGAKVGPAALWALAALVLVGPPAAAAMAWMGDWLAEDFFSSMLANLIATSVGIVGGVPVGVAIVRWQERRANAIVNDQQARHLAAVEKRLRAVLRAELEINLKGRSLWQESLAKDESLLQGFLTARWDVLKASGEFSHFGDIDALGQIAQLYEMYASFNRLLHVFYEVFFYPGPQYTIGGGTTLKQDMVKGLRTNLAAMLTSIERQQEVVKSLLADGSS